MRPTTMILGADNRKRWSPLDVLVMQAYQTLENERCPHCGYYVWLCHNEDPRLQATIKDDVCWVTDQVDDAREKRKDDEKAKYLRPELYTRDESRFAGYREAYYEAQAELITEEEAD